jgi:dihydrofolate reductase
MNKRWLSMIVAMDKNRLIGAGGGLPWRLPDDMKWFVDKTMGKPVIMGRKTYDSIPPRFKPLKGRHNIVVTHNPEYKAPGCTVVGSLTEALTAVGKAEEIIIGGGAHLYEQFLPQANRLYLTLVEGEFNGDVYFPAFDLAEWHEVYHEIHDIDERHPYRFTWMILER